MGLQYWVKDGKTNPSHSYLLAEILFSSLHFYLISTLVIFKKKFILLFLVPKIKNYSILVPTVSSLTENSLCDKRDTLLVYRKLMWLLK